MFNNSEPTNLSKRVLICKRSGSSKQEEDSKDSSYTLKQTTAFNITAYYLPY